MAMEIDAIRKRVDLIVKVGSFRPERNNAGSVFFRAIIWDGRIVEACYAGNEMPSIVSIEHDFTIEQLVDLVPFVDRMLNHGTEFVTQIGAGRDKCVFKWRIIRV